MYTGRPSSSNTSDLRVTLKANDLTTKQQWVIRIRELIQENDLYHDLSMHENNNNNSNNKQTTAVAAVSNKVPQLITNSTDRYGKTRK